MEHLKYPVGKFVLPQTVDEKSLANHIHTIMMFPGELKKVLSTFSEKELDSAYRPGGWTARQVIHHISDSHNHALIRFKWSLTEDNPTIKPYLESKYAILADYSLPVNISVSIITGIHVKWCSIFDSMAPSDWSKGYFHPDANRFYRLDMAAALYDWHCRHHLAHIKLCKQ